MELTDEEVHRRVMHRLRNMTCEERKQSLIDAGILTPDLELTEPYRTPPVISYRECQGDYEDM